MKVLPDGEAGTGLMWIVDVLPHEIGPYIEAQMDQAAVVMQATLARKS